MTTSHNDRFSDPEQMSTSLAPGEDGQKLSASESPIDTASTIEGGSTSKSLVDPAPSQPESNAIREVREALKRKERENKRLEAELAEWKNKSKDDDSDDPAPDPHKYPQDQLHKYVADLAAHSARKAVKEEQKKHHARKQEEYRHGIEHMWRERVNEARSKYNDFDKVISASHTEHAAHVVDEVKKSEYGADILYHLASHPEKASKLNSLSPHETMREIARLEGLIESGRHKQPQVSSAPEPHSPVRESATGTHIPTDDDVFNGEMDAYRANRGRILKK